MGVNAVLWSRRSELYVAKRSRDSRSGVDFIFRSSASFHLRLPHHLCYSTSSAYKPMENPVHDISSQRLSFDNTSLGAGVAYDTSSLSSVFSEPYPCWGLLSDYDLGLPFSPFDDTLVDNSASTYTHPHFPAVGYLSVATQSPVVASNAVGAVTYSAQVPEADFGFTDQVEGAHTQTGYSTETPGYVFTTVASDQFPSRYPYQVDWSPVNGQSMFQNAVNQSPVTPSTPVEFVGQQISRPSWQEPTTSYSDISHHSLAPIRSARAARYAPYSPSRNNASQRAAQTPSPLLASSSTSSTSSSSSIHSPVTSPVAAATNSITSLREGNVTFKFTRCWCGVKVYLLESGSPGEAMMKHLHEFHGLPRVRSDPHTCPWEECKKKYIRNNPGSDNLKSLKRHINRAHLGARFFCRNYPRCNAVFTREDTRNKHFRKGKCKVLGQSP
ncbi:hypothetical protein E1B28_013256 [Marasmius oreades]|uniref:C2H2-type domain-containing protein n=1 Tax=Marasmius oreades TaxID=181124 RepID=A0A9P7RQ19_9AGAR|nr:uncharacterized protein E1B28_013256 [Marasmius oreades]KAG7087278.1 hypothetical protein E1B28_013256 [Marasmius oreades]